MDGILVFGSNNEEHDLHLDAVAVPLQKRRTTVLWPDGVKPDDSKVEAQPHKY